MIVNIIFTGLNSFKEYVLTPVNVINKEMLFELKILF